MDELAAERGSPLAQRMGLVVGLFLFLLLLLAPQLGLELGLDSNQRAVAASTALVATLWITVALPVGVTAMLPLVLFPTLGVMSAGEVAPSYMNDLVLLFLGAFVVALGLERWGVHERLALGVIVRLGSSPRRLVLGFMLAPALLSMWINNTATALLMLPIAAAVIERVGRGLDEAEQGAFARALLLGIAYSCSVGGMGTPVGTAPNVQFLLAYQESFPDAPAISFTLWMLAWVPLVLLFVPLGWLLMTRVVQRLPARSGDPEAEQLLREEYRSLGPMTAPQLRMSLVFAATALLWVTRADLQLGTLRIPGWSRLLLGPEAADPAFYRANVSYVSDSTVAVAMAIATFLIPARKGEMLMDWRTASRLPWDVLLLLGGGLCIARGFKASGLDIALGEQLAVLFEGNSEWVVVAGTALFVCVLTEVTSNTATAAVLLPVLGAAAVHAGISPLLVMAPATIAASAAFMLPVATPPNAVVFSSRRVPVPVMARTGLWFNFLLVALITVVFQLWVRRVWGIEAELPAWARPG